MPFTLIIRYEPLNEADGGFYMCFAIESQLDMIAEKLKLDPVEIRLKNARCSHEQLPNGDNVHNCGLSDLSRNLRTYAICG